LSADAVEAYTALRFGLAPGFRAYGVAPDRLDAGRRRTLLSSCWLVAVIARSRGG